MDDIVFSAGMSFAWHRFDQLAGDLQVKLRGLPPSGNHEDATNLYQEFRRDFDRGCTEWARSSWSITLSDLLRPILASISLPEMRLLYLATDNGGMEYSAADDAEEVFPRTPWIEEEIIRRASQRGPADRAQLIAGLI